MGRALIFGGLIIVGLVLLAGRAGDGPGSSTSPARVAPTTAPVTPAEPVVSPTSVPTVAPTAEPVASVEATPRSVADLPLSGSGTFAYSDQPGTTFGAAPYLRFSVAVEEGLDVDPDEVAAFVDETLADRRSWIGDGVTGLERVAEGGTFTLVVASPDTVDRLCRPLNTAGELSCGANGYIALNLLRWETAVEEWPADLTTYRRYLVNHEVGHYLVGPAHPPCPGVGEPAPLMMQQTKGLDGCLPNGWPYPDDEP